MNNLERCIILTASMSKPEKRGFKLYCNTQDGDKIYIQLYDIIDNSLTEEYGKIENKFTQNNQNRNIEGAADYLYKMLLNFLSGKQSEKKIQSKIYRLIEKANVLFERKLFDEAFEYLYKAKDYAVLYQDDIMQILISRIEMRNISYLDFPSLTEKELVGKQMKLLEQMKFSKSINQYNFLLDILKHRLLYKGMSNSKQKKEELNDLVLSELSLISNSPDINFQSQKLHLLFQSTYHLEVEDYVLAVRNYKRLINLFNENSHLMLNPPIYYLSAIEGILDSLLSIGIYSEMQHFMEILDRLCKSEYPTDFQLKVLWLSYYYQMSIILHTGAFEKVDEVQLSFAESLIKKIPYLSIDSQLQFYLTNTLLLFSQNKLKEALRMIKNIYVDGKVYQQLPLFRIVRLVNVLLHIELGNISYVESEVIAYKRFFSLAKQLSKTEKLVFKFIQSYPLPRYHKSKEQLWKYYKKKIDLIQRNKLEQKYLKQFNFFAFVESRLTDVSLKNILTKKNLPAKDI